MFTIGHSNHALQYFVDLLKKHAIEVLVDVRSQPRSKYAPHFDAHELKASMPAAGIEYLFLGRELGGQPEAPGFYDTEGFVLYSRIAESPPFQEGISRLERGIQQYRVAIMCSEENPAECHRRLLVGRVLTERGVDVLHIRGDGRLQPETEMAAEEHGNSSAEAQLPLFESKPPEERSWRSIRSVSRRGPRRPSLEP